MVMQATTPEEIAQRRAKILRKAKNIRDYATLQAVLASLPECEHFALMLELQPKLPSAPTAYEKPKVVAKESKKEEIAGVVDESLPASPPK